MQATAPAHNHAPKPRDMQRFLGDHSSRHANAIIALHRGKHCPVRRALMRHPAAFLPFAAENQNSAAAAQRGTAPAADRLAPLRIALNAAALGMIAIYSAVWLWTVWTLWF